MFTHYVKVLVAGPYLPESGSIIDNFLIKNKFVDNYEWAHYPEGTNLNLSEGLTGVTLSIKQEVKNGVAIYFKILHETADMKEPFKTAEDQAKKLCALLSVMIKNGRYFHQMISATVEPQENFPAEVEGPLSLPLKNIVYHSNSITEEQSKFLNAAAKYISEDVVIAQCIKYYISAMDIEIILNISDDKVMLAYYKVIEYVGGEVAKKNQIADEEKETQYENLINELIKYLNANEKLKNRKKRLREASYKLRVIDDSIISDKIKKAAKILKLSEETNKNLDKLIETRNKLLAHTGHSMQLNYDEALLFREVAKEFIKGYLGLYCKVSIEEVNNEKEAKLFRDNGFESYLVSARYDSKTFTEKKKKIIGARSH